MICYHDIVFSVMTSAP